MAARGDASGARRNALSAAPGVRQPASALGLAPLAGDVQPAFAFQSTDFWAQGFQLGLELNY